MKRATKDLFVEIFKTLKPLPDLTISEWAESYRRLSSESAAEPGKWRNSKAPYQKEIMDAISNSKTPKVVVMTAAQVGKTDGFILNTIGYYMCYEPSPIMVMNPTIKLAETFSKDRLSPMLRDTPILKDKVNDKSRTSGNTILQKIFPGGHITMVGANSAASLASRPIRILLADEVDRYPSTAGSEGDPVLLASKRLTTFWNKKEVLISTPTIKGLSRIEIEYENSTQEEWCVPCPECGALQPLEWGRLNFDENNLETITYTCEICGVINEEQAWKERFSDGKFIAKYPRRKARGFHLNSLASLFVDWAETVKKWIDANKEKKKGNIELLKTFVNTELGETWEEEGVEIENDDLYGRREKYGCEVPNEVIILTAGVDTQDDRFEVEVVGWGEEKENWGIKYQIIYGDLKKEEVWNNLDKFLEQTFTKEDGTRLKILCTCMDSGGHFTKEVYQFCKKREARHIYAIKGKGGADVPYISRVTTSNRYKAKLFTIGVDTGKSLLYQRLDVKEQGANYCHFPKEKDKGYTKDYFKGLTAEKKITIYKKGRAQHTWVLKEAGYKRNEPLDIRNYATAALEISGAVLKKKSETETVAKGKKRTRRQRSGGIG